MTARPPLLVLLAGCGDIGLRVADIVTADGDVAIGLRRHVDGLPGTVVPFTADLTRPETLQDLPADLAAVVVSTTADSRTVEAYRQTYVDGTRNLIDALVASGQRPHLVLVSSTGVLGDADGGWVDETTPPSPQRPTAEELLRAEQVALDAPMPVAVLRASGIYGPGRERLLTRARDGAELAGPGDAWTNRVHADDLAAAIVLTIRLGLTGVLHASDDEPVLRAELRRWLAEQIGAPIPDGLVPESPSRGQGKRVGNGRLRAAGWQPAHPTFRSGYRAMIDAAG